MEINFMSTATCSVVSFVVAAKNGELGFGADGNLCNIGHEVGEGLRWVLANNA